MNKQKAAQQAEEAARRLKEYKREYERIPREERAKRRTFGKDIEFLERKAVVYERADRDPDPHHNLNRIDQETR
jgi:hypothetical protein